jgi:hypothetical protein
MRIELHAQCAELRQRQLRLRLGELARPPAIGRRISDAHRRRVDDGARGREHDERVSGVVESRHRSHLQSERHLDGRSNQSEDEGRNGRAAQVGERGDHRRGPVDAGAPAPACDRRRARRPHQPGRTLAKKSVSDRHRMADGAHRDIELGGRQQREQRAAHERNGERTPHAHRVSAGQRPAARSGGAVVCLNATVHCRAP